MADTTIASHDEDTTGKEAGGPVGVLVVDDQAVFRQVAREVIDAMSDFTWVGDAESGEVALERATELHADLVILDVRMGGMSGPEAAARLRFTEPRARVILISVDEAADLPFEASQCGASEIVRKRDFGSALLRRLWTTYGAGPEPEMHPRRT